MLFLQMLPWERFGALSVVPVEFNAVKLENVVIDRVNNEKTSHGLEAKMV